MPSSRMSEAPPSSRTCEASVGIYFHHLRTMNARTLLTILTLAAATPLGAQKAPDITPYLIAVRLDEIMLARSAAPFDISATATVLVLTPKGYVEAWPGTGTNGFTCLVMRSFGGAPDDPGFWNPKIRGPMCYNAPATRTVLPVNLAQIDWVLAGVPPAELNARLAKAFAEQRFAPPAPGAMVYMLSRRQVLSDAYPHWMPHLMFYYDRTVTAPAFGAGGMTAPVIDASAGDPKGPMQVFYVPTRTWSNGAPAVPATHGK